MDLTAITEQLINHRNKILAYAEACLASCFDGTRKKLRREPMAPILEADWPEMRVNITLRCAGVIQGSMSGKGINLGTQIRWAVTRSALDRRFRGPLTRVECEKTSIEVWIQTSAEEIGVAERDSPTCLDFGVDGVELTSASKFAYYKPSVAITSSMKTAQDVFASLCKKAELEEGAWRLPDASIRKTRWVSLLQEKAGGSRWALNQLRSPARVEFKKETFLEWVKASCGYFVNHQSADGNISYLYNPIKNTLGATPSNIVRQSGCLLSLSRVLGSNLLADDTLVQITTENLANFLVKKLIPWQDGCAILVDESSANSPKLGATALLMAALGSSSIKDVFSSNYAQLRNSLHRSQLPSGRFITNFGSDLENRKQIEFYSGQALLALWLEAENGCEVSLDMCAKAFEPYRAHFRAAPTTAFVGWHVDGWARMYASTMNQAYADFAFEQADWILTTQIQSSPNADYIGGFSRDGKRPSYSTIVFVEAILSALRVALLIGDDAKVARYKAAARIGLEFCARLRLEAVPSAFFPDPKKCEGGIAIGLAKKTVRCDVVQHFITLSLSAMSIPQLCDN